MFDGCFPALVTPFNEDLSIDWESFGKLLTFQIDAGVAGYVACGSTGEAATLEDAEYQQVISVTKKFVSDRKLVSKPVIAGVNSSSTKRAIAIAEMAREAGADSLLLVAPPYNKPPQSGILEHFRAVKKAVPLPLIAYNIPGRAAVTISSQTLLTLAEEGTIQAIKESTGNLDLQLDALHAVGNSAELLAGDDSFLLSLLSVGATGSISAVANIAPREFVGICDLFKQKALSEAKALQMKLLPLIRLSFIDTNPIAVKHLLMELGIISHDGLRLPLVPLSERSKAAVKDFLQKTPWLVKAHV